MPLGRDFYTAVSASRFFGGAIAKYILGRLESSKLALPLNIIDLGANNANLLNDIRAFLGSLGVGVAEKCDFIAVESSPYCHSERSAKARSEESANPKAI